MKTTRTLESLIGESGWFSGTSTVEIEDTRISDRDARVAFVVPIYNQELLVDRCLSSIVACAAGTFELCVIVDGCTDATGTAVASWADQRLTGAPGNMTRLIVASTPEGVFETLADSIGISLTDAPIVVEVQVDMQILEPGFDQIFVDAFESIDDLFAISGRGVHSIDHVLAPSGKRTSLRRTASRIATKTFRLINRRKKTYAPSILEYRLSSELGRVGELVDKPAARPKKRKRRVYVGDTIMRGPLALRRDRFDSLGGFDRASFFLGDDDHDLCVRAWTREGWVCGYTPIAFSSPTDLGSTRKQRDTAEQARFDAIKAHYTSTRRSSVLATQGRSGCGPRKKTHSISTAPIPNG